MPDSPTLLAPMPRPCVYPSHPTSTSLNGGPGSKNIPIAIYPISLSSDGLSAIRPQQALLSHPTRITAPPSPARRSSRTFCLESASWELHAVRFHPILSPPCCSPPHFKSLMVARANPCSHRPELPSQPVRQQRDTFRHLPRRAFHPTSTRHRRSSCPHLHERPRLPYLQERPLPGVPPAVH